MGLLDADVDESNGALMVDVVGKRRGAVTLTELPGTPKVPECGGNLLRLRNHPYH